MEPLPPNYRYRCSACGNLTRFDVIERARTRRFYHFSMGGEMRVEEEHVLEAEVEKVECRWCSSTSSVEMVPAVLPLQPEEG